MNPSSTKRSKAGGDVRTGEPEVVELRLEPRGAFPNNPRLPVLLYRAAFRLPGHGDAARVIEDAFERNGWSRGWRNGVYDYQHYHSTSHEALGCYAGRASVQVGGPEGPVLEFARGDALILPAGTAHKSLESSPDFSVVGSSPGGVAYDLLRGKPDEPPDAERRIAAVALPESDPVFGSAGPLLRRWQ
jgi:uncharacterized protein YjlB